MPKRRSGSVMKTLGSCNLLLLVVVVLCVVYAGAMGNTHTPEHLHQVFGRFLLQANENAETLQRCDQIPGNISAPNCTTSDPKQDLSLLQKKPDEDSDDGYKDAVVPASVVAAVVGFIGSFTLVLGYVCYRKDPDKFRKRYGKAMALLPTRHAQRPSEIAALGPPQQAGQLSIGQPSPIVAHVPPPRPPISSGAAVTYGQPRRPEPASMPFTISLTSSSPSTHANRDHPPGSVASAVVDSGFVLPGNVPQVPGPRTVPPPILSFEKDRHPVPAAQGPRPFQLPQHQVEVSHWGQSDLHSFGYPGTNPPDTVVSSVPSQQAAAEPGPRLASGPDHMVGYNGPLRSPFDPPDSIGSSQWDYERQATVDSARQQIDTNSDDMNAGVSPIHQVDHPGLITIPEQACPDLNYDIRVLPLSERPTELGKGTFGTVEPGVFTDSGGNIVHVAVKYGNELFYSKTPKDVLRIFQSELDVMCRVPAHANIVRCYGGRVKFDNEDNIGARDVYIVEELMHANLQDVIHGDDFTGGLPYNLILKIALHIATGLEHLHRSGVLHYDLKPANILVDEDFNAKIADFGASKVKAKSYISGTGFRGTLGYMAPELMLGVFVKHVPINEKIDVYSFGVVLWEMVERQYPPDPLSAGAQNLDGVDQEVLREGINDDRFQLNRRCPEGLRQLIEDCVNLTPAVRPNATEVRERVEVLLAQSQHRTDLTTNVDV